MLVEVGFDVTLDALGLGALETAFLDFRRNIAREAVQRRDFSHVDVVPLGLPTADEKNADAVIPDEDLGQRPDIGIQVEENPVAGRMGQMDVLPELFSLAGKNGQAVGVIRHVLAEIVLDHVQVPGQRSFFILVELQAVQPGPAVRQKILGGDKDFLLRSYGFCPC